MQSLSSQQKSRNKARKIIYSRTVQ